MALTVGELVANIDADDSGMRRGLSSAEAQLRGFQLDAEGRLRRLDGTFASLSERIEAGFERADGSSRRFGFSLGRLGGLAGGLGGIVAPVAKIAAALGTAVPLAAGLVGLIGQIAPAAGLAVAGLFTMVLATQTLKIGMKGVGDAVSAALDPSDPEAFAEAIKNLAPSAQAFAKGVRALQPQLKELQQGVQEQLFYKFDGVLKELGKHTLPVLHEKMEDAASSLNLMGRGIGNAVVGLSMSGTLGKALTGATSGLYNLAAVPSQIVVALTQVGAAAAPAFGRLTEAAGAGADRLSERFSKAFESGGVQRAIEQAIALARQFGAVLGNVGSIIGSLFGAAQATGAGFLGTLQTITGALADAFASPAVQAGLKAIFSTMSTLAQTVGPLLTTALQAVAPVFVALGPPVQRLVSALGAALQPVVVALGPVLETAATAVGVLVDAALPLLPVISGLAVGLLSGLTPVLHLTVDLFRQLTPVIKLAAGILQSTLAPILAVLPAVLTPIVESLSVLASAVLPLVSEQAASFAPVLAQLAGIVAELLVALAPVITQLILLAAKVLTDLTPMLITVMGWVSKLAGAFAGELGRVINTVVLPALQAIVLLLQGDFSGAWAAAKVMVQGAVDSFVRLLVELPGRAGAALASLAPVLWGRIQEAGGRFNEGVRQKRDEAIARIREIPSQAAGALGDLGGILWNAGASLIRGLVDGIKSKIGSIRSTLSGVTGMLPDWKGPAAVDAKILRPAGRLLMQGFQRGITDETPSLQAQLGGLTGALPGMALGSASGGLSAGSGTTRVVVELAGPQEMRALIRGIVQKTGGTVETVFGTR